jgi:hypothetical protein
MSPEQVPEIDPALVQDPYQSLFDSVQDKMPIRFDRVAPPDPHCVVGIREGIETGNWRRLRLLDFGTRANEFLPTDADLHGISRQCHGERRRPEGLFLFVVFLIVQRRHG